MSLNLINPVVSSSTGSYRIHQNSLLSKAKELTSGLKNKSSHPINDQIVGCKFKNSASIMTQIRSNTTYATNILSKAENDLEHIGDILGKMKEVVASATTNANSSNLNHLNDIYQSKVAELVKYIDNSRFDGRNLFDGSLQDLKIRIGEEFDNINTISIPKLLVSYDDLGINGLEDYKKQQEDLLLIKGNIEDIDKQIKDLENKIVDQGKLKSGLLLFEQQKEELINEFNTLPKLDSTLDEQLETLKFSYGEARAKLLGSIEENNKECQNLESKRQGLEEQLFNAKEELNNKSENLRKEKEINLEAINKNCELLNNTLNEKTLEHKEIKDKITQLTKDFDIYQQSLKDDLKIKKQSFLQKENYLTEIKQLKSERGFKEIELSELAKNIEKAETAKSRVKELEAEVLEIEKEINSLNIKDIKRYENKIEGYKQEVQKTIPKKLKDELEKKALEELEIENIKSSIAKVNEINKDGDLEVSGKLYEFEQALKSRNIRLETIINANIVTLNKNLIDCKSAVKSGEDKITKYHKLTFTKTQLIESIKSQDIQSNFNDGELAKELNQAQEYIKDLDRRIHSLEEKLAGNMTQEKDLTNINDLISKSKAEYEAKIDIFADRLKVIDEAIIELKKQINDLSDNNDLEDRFKLDLEGLQNDFIKEDNNLSEASATIQEELQSILNANTNLHKQILDLDQVYKIENSYLENEITKQNSIEINRLRIKEEIDSLELKIADAHSQLLNEEALENLKNELTTLEEEKDKNQQELLNIDANIRAFITNRDDALKNHGGLFIREELENSSIVALPNIQKAEELIDMGLKKLFTIQSHSMNTKASFAREFDSFTKNIQLLNEMSNKYLSTDYQEAAEKYKDAFLSLNAVINIQSQGDVIAREIIKLIETR